MDILNQRVAIIIPVYNEASALEHNANRILSVLRKDLKSFQIIFVNDGSKDDTWSVVEDLAHRNKEVVGLSFSRNFGKETALVAGMDYATADYYVFMDSDLQHPPEEVKAMLIALNTQGVNIIEGVKANRGKESFVYRLVSVSFYKFLHAITGLDMNNSSDFKVIDHQVVESLKSFNERNLFFRGLVDWVGYKKANYAFEVHEREAGTSSFSVIRLAMLALNAVVAYTSKPLYLTVFTGLIFALFALGLGLQTLVNYMSGEAVSGFSTVILLQLIIGAMVMFCLGVIGVYISRIYDEIKSRPRYLVEKSITKDY